MTVNEADVPGHGLLHELETRFPGRVGRVDPTRWSRIFVVGDVHGCLRELEELLDEIAFGDDDLLLCVGDIVDKGPESAAALRTVLEAPNIRSVQGNGEAKLVRGEIEIEGLDPTLVQRVAGWPLVLAAGSDLVLHGGLDPRRPVAEHTPVQLRNMRSLEHGSDYRSPYWFEAYRGSHRIFFGHSATREPLRAERAVGLDTGCVYGGRLTAYDVGEDRFVSVEAHRVYRARDPGDYLDAGSGNDDAETDREDEALEVPEPPASASRDASSPLSPAPSEEPDLSRPELYLNREFSELEFQRRVLHEARDERNPLLERLKFLAIFTKNMDEFFMKRVGGLKQQISAGVAERTPDGLTPREQWDEVLERARGLYARHVEVYHRELRPRLAAEGVRIVDRGDLDEAERIELQAYFENFVLPTLTPLTFDPAHPFPFISNLSLSLAVLTREPGSDEGETFSRVKIPKNRPRLVPLGQPGEEGWTFVPLEQCVAAYLDHLFPDVEIVHHSTFKVTRNAQVRRNQEVAEDLIEMIEEVLRERRFATVVSLQLSREMPDRVRRILRTQLDLEARETFELPPPLDFRDFMPVAELELPGLSAEPWNPRPHPRLAEPIPTAESGPDVFEEIRRRDLLVHHPYHSFGKTVHRFLREAARDPHVLAIKASIYRTATESRVVQTLIEAAQNGKQVAVMLELKARFDEENNLRWAERLEEEGIHVAYGTIGYKTHTKITLVVREETAGVRLYSHVGTGNYHSETAKTYEDLGLLTADWDVGQDVVRLFNYFTGHTHHKRYRKMLVAPVNMRRAFTGRIRREAELARGGRTGRIIAKMNGLEDPALVRELYRASMAGVEIDLIVRGICRLRPGVEGVSERIRVHSVVGRFLEHSRIYYFGNDGDPRYYLGSADWMTRNLDHRIETVVPVEDEAARVELDFVLETLLRDNRRRWVLGPEGSYEQCRPAPGEETVDTHRVLRERAREAAAGAGPSP